MAKPTATEIRLKLEKQRKILRRFMQTPDGEEALKYLEIKFCGQVHKPGDPYTTHFNVGRMDVVNYLQLLREEEEHV